VTPGGQRRLCVASSASTHLEDRKREATPSQFLNLGAQYPDEPIVQSIVSEMWTANPIVDVPCVRNFLDVRFRIHARSVEPNQKISREH
jgi:hypothetical protein